MQACCAVSLVLALRLCMRGIASADAVSEPFAVPIRLELNSARVPELMLLDGIGRARAEQIVLHRVRYGPFRALDDLLAVDGIGPDTVETLRPFLREPDGTEAARGR